MSDVILDTDLKALRHSGRAAELVASFDKRRAKYGFMYASMISQMKAAPGGLVSEIGKLQSASDEFVRL